MISIYVDVDIYRITCPVSSGGRSLISESCSRSKYHQACEARANLPRIIAREIILFGLFDNPPNLYRKSHTRYCGEEKLMSCGVIQ